MRNKKLSVKAALSLALSMILFCMPAIGLAMNGSYAVDAHAEESMGIQAEDGAAETGSLGETGTGQEDTSQENEGQEDTSQGNTESGNVSQEGTEDTVQKPENDPEADSDGDSTVSGNDAPEPECTCGEKCSQYSVKKDCGVCSKGHSLCEYVNPNVKISIRTPAGWHNNTTKVPISVEDVAKSGNFTIKTVQAKIAQNGSWTDITEDMYVEISENSTVYVLVTDQKGNTYERNRHVKCFDFVKPTLNAAVSDGLLSVQAHDTDSGIRAVYVNGYEFTEITNGVLNIRLQQFDAGYQYFTIQAMDNAGNMSEVYKTANPYYTDPEAEDSGEGNPAEQLPVSAEATKPSSATGKVTEHTKTDSDGNTTSETSLAEQKKAAMREAAATEAGEREEESTGGEEEEQTGKGKEFYTIQTASDKVFYLIIDRDGEEELVYFLTEITENDLLNVTSDNSEVLPQNSAALESAIPVTEQAQPNNNVEQGQEPEEVPEEPEGSEGETTEEPEEVPDSEGNPFGTYIVLGVAALIGIGAGYYFKVARKKKEDFLDEDDEEDEEEIGAYENEDEEPESSPDDDFFEGQEDE